MTTKSKTTAVALVFILCATAIFSLPHIAVLDTVLAPGIDPSVVVPVTDKIIEELLNSGKFIVIDRANVEQILREKEFQLSSGVVRNEEVRQAGEYLGADLVLVANASRVGSTYVITAKMIDVVTGEISAQASNEKQGKIDVLLEIARLVGKQISGQEFVVAEATKELEEKKPEVVVEVEKKPAVQGDALALAQMQELISARTHMRRGGDIRMAPLASQLSDQQRMMLFTSNRKDNAVTALLLNWLVPSLGSFLQGDITGGIVELTLIGTGALMVANGESYDYWDGWYYNTFWYVGWGVLGVYVVYYVIRPFTFVRQWNQNLAKVLQVPYFTMLDPRKSTFTLVPTEKGLDWRFGLSLVSIEY